MSTLTHVLGWVAMFAFICVVTWDSVQLTRPDDNWKGWDDLSARYEAPRWGVQPRPLLRLIVVLAASVLLADWLWYDTASIVSAWLK
jgi:hypothetical protein